MSTLDSSPSPRSHQGSAQAVQLHVVLVEPEIPPNTGNIIRLCANTGAILHLVGPLGFPIDSAKMRRAGLDYHEQCLFEVYKDWSEFLSIQGPLGPDHYALTTKGHRSLFEASLTEPAWLVFGPESRGLSEAQLAAFPRAQRLRLPMQPESRSLNLSNAVAVSVYEAWRQQGFDGLSKSQPVWSGQQS